MLSILGDGERSGTGERRRLSITGDRRGDKKFIMLMLVFLTACGCCLFSPLIAVGNVFTHGASDFRNQCDSAIGPDPSSTATTSPARTSEPEVTQSALPSTNPYSSMTIDAQDRNISDRYRACVSALRSAPYQRPGAVRTPNSGTAAACAQHLAFRYLDESSGDSAALARDVIYAASTAALTGQCTPAAAPAGSDTVPGGCGDPDGPRRAVVLPETAGRQGYCGQQVTPTAATAGDLIFWDYRENAATRVGIAVGAGEMVTGGLGDGRFFRAPIPATDDVRIKRVLGGEL
ncbi:NlpC/P60 family protein [Nocardia sp. NPDC051750]|uniref:NlpC/P60 family protein n=1 Tax=Nocardia sp. NPDC051750 TaxID=3364325 RepID=UPI00378838CB